MRARLLSLVHVFAVLAVLVGNSPAAGQTGASQPLDWRHLAETDLFAQVAEPIFARWPCLRAGAGESDRLALGAILRRLEAATQGRARVVTGWRRWLRLRAAATAEPCFGNLLVADVIDRSLVITLAARAAAGASAQGELAEPVAELRGRPLSLDRIADFFSAELGARFRDPRSEPGFANLSSEEQARLVLQRASIDFMTLIAAGEPERFGAYALAERPDLGALVWRAIRTDELVHLALPIAITLAARPEAEIAPEGLGSPFSPFSPTSTARGRALLDRARTSDLENLLGFDYSHEGYRRRGIERGRFSWRLGVGSVRLGEPIPLRLDVEDPGGGFDISRPATFVGPKGEAQEPPVVGRVTGPAGATMAAFERTPVGLGKASVSLLAEVKAKSKTSYWLFLAVDSEGAPLLSKPGEYRIEIDYHPMVVKSDGRRAVDRSITRSSGPLVLRVEAVPEPAQACYQEIGRTGFTWVLTDARGLHFWEVGDEDLETIEKGLASLRATCAGTVYAPYLDLARGRLVLRRLDHRLPVTDDPSLAEALKELGRRESFPLAPMAREVADRLLSAAMANPLASDLDSYETNSGNWGSAL